MLALSSASVTEFVTCGGGIHWKHLVVQLW